LEKGGKTESTVRLILLREQTSERKKKKQSGCTGGCRLIKEEVRLLITSTEKSKRIERVGESTCLYDDRKRPVRP